MAQTLDITCIVSSSIVHITWNFFSLLLFLSRDDGCMDGGPKGGKVSGGRQAGSQKED